MSKIATFGEIMLRLSPPGQERFFQTPALRCYFGGGEANVAVSLALFGCDVRYVSVIPAGDIGDAAVAELRKWGVGTDSIVRQGLRLGIYFVESGSGPRPSKVIYDRIHSAMAEAAAGDIDWNRALEGVVWFHTSGITPALSRTAAALTLEAVKAAKAKGITVSVDLNFRAKLWNYGSRAPEVMREVFRYADIGMSNEEDCQKSLGIEADGEPEKGRIETAAFEKLTAKVMTEFPNLVKIAVTLRESRGAEENGWSAVMRTRKEFLIGSKYDIRNIVDRIGAGDAFDAGLIHGLCSGKSDREALEFAVAASCLKHTIPGDFNLARESEVKSLLRGDRSGRIQR